MPKEKINIDFGLIWGTEGVNEFSPTDTIFVDFLSNYIWREILY